MSSITYRPDIDGLRAIAILSVVLFHADIPGFPGGYVGVDVFFVISGYLIASIIFKDIEAGRFSFLSFWERRARRILPALCFMLFTTLVAGWFLMLPADYESLGKQTTALSFFVSNFLFYAQDGYFDLGLYLNPLYHTWSLGVEEQFYILFPLITVFFWRKFTGKVFYLLLLVTLASFIACVAIMRSDVHLAFYMLPFRAWELLAGALLAFKKTVLPARVLPFMAFAGLAGIFYPVFMYGPSTDFPGIGALMPVLGTVAVILAGSNGATIVNRALSFRPLVFVGIVSYSWYLWHWPLIAFAKYIPSVYYNLYLALACVAVSFVMAILSWRYIERPFRNFQWLPTRKQMFRASVCALGMFALIGMGLIATSGLPQRLDPVVAKYAGGMYDQNPYWEKCNRTDVSDVAAGNLCQTAQEAGDPSFIVWGDSQADVLVPLFYDLSAKYRRNGYIATNYACEAVLDMRKGFWNAENNCKEFNSEVFGLIKAKNIKNVFLISRYAFWMETNASIPNDVIIDSEYPEGYQTVIAAGLARTIDLLRAEGVHVYLMMDVPQHFFNLPQRLALSTMYGLNKPGAIKYEDYKLYNQKQMVQFLDRYGRDKITVIDPSSYLCRGGTCVYEDNGYSLYSDGMHLSTKGAMFLAPVFEPYFQEMD